MADENSNIISWLKGILPGSTPDSQNKTILAEPRKAYPTDEDVDFAKKYDYSYGQPWAPEFEGHSVRILAGNPNKTPLQGETLGTTARTVDQLLPGRTDSLKNIYGKAALASEGSGLAKLGFDPNRTVLDLLRTPEETGVNGMYYPGTDDIYSNPKAQPNIMHESIHRGIEKLHNSPFWKPEFDEITKGDMDEYLVRHLMKTKMGNPEASYAGDLGKQQRAAADWSFNQASQASRRKELVDQIEAAAAQAVAAKRPGGPR